MFSLWLCRSATSQDEQLLHLVCAFWDGYVDERLTKQNGKFVFILTWSRRSLREKSWEYNILSYSVKLTLAINQSTNQQMSGIYSQPTLESLTHPSASASDSCLGSLLNARNGAPKPAAGVSKYNNTRSYSLFCCKGTNRSWKEWVNENHHWYKCVYKVETRPVSWVKLLQYK